MRLALSSDPKYTVSTYLGRKVMRDSADERWMRLAIELAWQCPPSPTAYSVGAVIVDARGDEISRGFSREGGDPLVHAEESALGKLAADDPRLAGGGTENKPRPRPPRGAQRAP